MNNAQELADLVKTKHKVIEELKNSLVEARNCVSAMEEEICSLQANRAEAEDEESLTKSSAVWPMPSS